MNRIQRIRRPARRPARCIEPAIARPAKTALDCCLRAWAGNATGDLKEKANGHDH